MKQYYIYLTTDHLHNKKYIGKHYGELDDDYYGSGKIITSEITSTNYGVRPVISISKTKIAN